MYERFTEKAIRVLMLAQEEARRTGHNFVGSEHVLLGLQGEGAGIAAKVLRAHRLNLKDLRIAVFELIGKGKDVVGAEIPFTPRAKRILEAGWNAARDLGHNYICTEHLLLGLLAVDDGVAHKVLKNRKVNLEQVNDDVLVRIQKASKQQQLGSTNPAHASVNTATTANSGPATAQVLPDPLVDSNIPAQSGIHVQSGSSVSPVKAPVAKPDATTLFSESAIKSMQLAQEEAGLVGSKKLELHHLLLGILSEVSSEAARLLSGQSVALEDLRLATTPEDEEKLSESDSQDFELTKQVFFAVEMASVAARRASSSLITPEYLLLALLSYEESRAVKGLQKLGVNIELFVDELRNVIKALSVVQEKVVAEEKTAESAKAAVGVVEDEQKLDKAAAEEEKKVETADLLQPTLALTTMVEHAISLAREEAHRLGHAEVDTDHLLLGLMTEADGLASLALHVWDVKTKELRQESENMPGREKCDSPCESKFGSKVNELILAARQLAREAKRTYVGTDHVLLALLADEESAGLKVLRNLSIDLDRLKKMLQRANTPPQLGAKYSALVPLFKQKGFERFSDEAIKALMFAKEEASRLGHSQIYSQFLLLGICDERLNKGAERLRKLGVSLDELRLEVEDHTGYGEGDCSSDVVFGEGALQAMQYAFDQVVAVGLELVRPEHLFVGIIVQDSGTVFDVLQKFNISVERLRENMALNLRKPALDSVTASHLEKVRQLLCLTESDIDELFTMPAIDALVRAQSEAITLLHSCFEPDHILLGLAGDKESTAAKALNISGIELHQLRSSAQHLDAKSSSKPQALKVSSQTKNALERAFDIAEQCKSTAIDSDHLLLSILEINACTELFRWGRLDLKRFKETVLELLGESRSKLVLATESLEPFDLAGSWPQGSVSELGLAEINAPAKVELTAEDLRAKHFDSSFSEVIKLAVLEAQRLGRNEVGTDHLQVGICAEGTTVAARVLNAIGVTDTLLRLTNEEQFGKGTDHSSGDLPFSKNAALAIEKAFNKARAFGSDIVGADQLLLGILDLQRIVDWGSFNREDCAGVTILRTLGVDIPQLRKLLLEQTSAIVDEAKQPIVAQSELQKEISNFSPDAISRFANFSADALKVVMVAQETGRALGYSLVGSEQILVGLMFVDEAKTAAALKLQGLTPEILISEISRFVGKEPTTAVVSFSYTFKAQQLFERAREAAALVDGPVTTEHLLLSLLSDKQSLASIILEQGREHPEEYWSLLEERFSTNLRTVINGAKGDSCRRNKGIVDAPHLLFALVNLPTDSCAHYLESIKLDRFAIRDKLDKLIPGTDQDKISTFVEFNNLAKQALLRAFQLSRFEGSVWVQTKHLLSALGESEDEQFTPILVALGLRPIR
ncbi:hypothetical protein KBI23_10775 [bacterium]|nr:hypothetical protein [bacterium]MBP9810290.1 hypothetical protein [bacterium]